MGGTKTSTWVLGTVFLALLILAGAWLLLIAPAMDAAAENRSQAENEQARIDQLQVQLVELKKDFENLDEYQADLAELQVQIPPVLDMSELTRQLATIASDSGVFIDSFTASTSISLSEALAAEVPATDAAVTDATAAEGEAAATDPAAETAPSAAAASAVPAGFYAVPISVQVLGPYANTLAFLQHFQTGNPRLLLVTSLNLEGQAAASAQGGKPAMADGDPATSIDGYAFVLQDPSAATGDPVIDEAPATLPVPNGQPNPFS